MEQKRKLKLWGVSDTHGLHRQLDIPEGIDGIIHAGDTTNYYDLHRNSIEFEDFFDWFSKIPIKYKILVPGNHDAWATKLYNKEKVKEAGIYYLEHEDLILEGIKFFGSPYTPTFGTWYFMKDRGKLHNYWEMISPNTDILITHGPPQGILDLSENPYGNLQQCGDSALLKAVNKIKPKYHIFGHIHDYKYCKNFGKLERDDTIFMNVSSVEDGRFDKGLVHKGMIITI